MYALEITHSVTKYKKNELKKVDLFKPNSEPYTLTVVDSL